jgi:hypothetical protein
VAIITAGAVPLLLAEAYGWNFSYAVMAALMTVGILAVLAAPREARHEQREECRPHVVRESEHEPVRDAVAVRELPDSEDPAVPGRDQGRDEGREREPAPHYEVLGRLLTRDAEEAEPNEDEEREVCPDKGEIDRGERAQNSIRTLAKTFRPAAGMK